MGHLKVESMTSVALRDQGHHVCLHGAGDRGFVDHGMDAQR
jgi:hypothetical protein